MREGSANEIKPGMKVVGRGGQSLGTVKEVIMDEGSGIFVGLAISPNLFVHAMKVRGEHVERLHEGVVYVTAAESDLRPYDTPEERHHDTAEAYESAAP